MECAGIGLLAAAAVVLPLEIPLALRGQSAMRLCEAILSAGVVIGAIVGWMRRPTILAAAVQADRQLDLSDLLATAWASRTGDDPWQQAVRASAARVCVSRSPGEVMLRRLGSRAWGGIGLSAALVMTIALMSSSGAERSAMGFDAVGGQKFLAIQQPQPSRHDPLSLESPSAIMPSAQQNESPQSRSFDEQRSADEFSRSTAKAIAHHSANAPADGAARARTDVRQALAAIRDSESDNDANAKGSIPTGGGTARPQNTDDESNNVRGVVPSNVSADALPWRSSSWTADSAAAKQAVRDGKISDRYRDVIDQYFRPN